MGGTNPDGLRLVSYITTDNEANEVLLFGCAVCFTIMGIVAAALLFNKIRAASPIRAEKPQKIYLSLLILFSLGESFSFFLYNS